jgi:AraC-like DNA-binding protein
LELTPGIPADYSGPLLPGGKFFSATTAIGKIIVQKLAGENYSLRYNLFHFFKKISLQARSVKPGLYARFMLKNNMRHDIKGPGKIHLREGNFVLLWSGQADCKTVYEKNREYRVLDIYYSAELARELELYFPQLENLVANNKDRPTIIGRKTRMIKPLMQDIILDLLNCPYDAQTNRFYFEVKVREFLFVLLADTFKQESVLFKFTSFESGRIQLARELLIKDISTKPLSTAALAKKVSINEFKLKKGFRQLFGMSILECFIEARMQKAKELLLTTDQPIKAICIQAGYPRITNFITAFRKRFGYTPGSLRRNNE